MGSDFWGGLLNWIRDTMLKEMKILQEDLAIFTVVDSPGDAVEIIKNTRV